jgi:hypothetical protein
MKRLIGASLALWVLWACSEDPDPPPQPASMERDESRARSVAGSGYGEYRKNDSTMVIRDHVHRWVKDQNKLVVIQTPARLPDQERQELAGGKNDFRVLFDNETPDPKKWSWYPYVVTEITFESSDVRADNIRGFYIKAYGIDQENHTDNLNASPGKDSVFEKVSLNEGKLTLRYAGNDSIMDDQHSWNITIGR